MIMVGPLTRRTGDDRHGGYLRSGTKRFASRARVTEQQIDCPVSQKFRTSNMLTEGSYMRQTPIAEEKSGRTRIPLKTTTILTFTLNVLR